MTNVPHLEIERLIALAEDAGAPAEEAVRAHLAVCADCAGQVARLAQTMELMRTDSAEDAPAALIARATRLFDGRKAAAAPSLWRRLQAVLQFDSLQMAPAMGMRAGGEGPRQMMFTAEDLDLDLRFTQVEEGWIVAGQLLGEGERGYVLLRSLDGAEPGEWRAELNELLEFVFLPAPAGRYSLTVRLDGIELIVPEIHPGAH